MFDISVEQIIKTKAPTRANVFKVLMIIADFLAITTIPYIYTIGFLLSVVFIVFTVFLFRFYDAEFEYSIVESELTVDKIMAKSMRKRCGVYDLGKASLVTNPGTQDSLRMEHRKLRTHSYTSNAPQAQLVEVYTMDSHNEMVKLILEPNEQILKAIKTVVNRNAYKVDAEIEEKLCKNKVSN